ncbi:MAG: type II toxin-antitoxin system RelE/ParE family toxin [Burkholderiales bacterium]|nr:type II toxin-antitoxin system RelE/ParE family toxin [Burkholderiales bacterium]
MRTLRFDSAARAELLHEIKFYGATRPGTGIKFQAAVELTLNRIEQSPAVGKPEEAGCRRMRVKGFPFSLVYREEPDEVVIYAVRPDAKDPGYWLQRVG